MRARENRPRLLVVVALLAASLPLLAPSARADDFAPEITSFERISRDLLGGHQAVTIRFSARDEGRAGLAYAHFSYATPLQGIVRVDSVPMLRASSGTFLATELLSPWAASGEYTLQEVWVYDVEGNETLYERGGSHRFDFRAADFSVDNPNEDVTTPTISSALLFQSEVLQGMPVVVLYSAEDDRSGVDEVVFSGWTPTRANYSIRSLPKLGAAGPATWLVPMSSPSGAYEPSAIHVADRAGNMVLYDVEGRVMPYPYGATVPPHDHPDPASLSFSVRGTTGDRVAPQMTRFSAISAPRRRPGDVVALDYETFDGGTGVGWVLAEWRDGRGHSLWASKSCGDLGSGPLSVRIEDYRTTGTDWELQSIGFADYVGNHAAYLRDGTVRYQGTDAGPPVHAFDLTQGDFHLEAGPPSIEDLLDTSSVYCPRIADVPFSLDDPDVTYGDTVTATGWVQGPSSRIDEPLVAIHDYPRRGSRLLDIVEGDSIGEFAHSFTAQETTTLTATFLGLDGPGGAEPGTSRKVVLTVRPQVTAALSATTIESGDAARLEGRVLPAAAAGEVLLQREAGRRWRTVQAAAADEGAFSFVLRPPRAGTYRYRVTVPGGPRLSAGHSPVLVLTVTR